jgi:hypothetical protein
MDVWMVVSLLRWMFGWWYCISALLSPTVDKSGNYPLLSTNASICQFPTFVVTYIWQKGFDGRARPAGLSIDINSLEAAAAEGRPYAVQQQQKAKQPSFYDEEGQQQQFIRRTRMDDQWPHTHKQTKPDIDYDDDDLLFLSSISISGFFLGPLLSFFFFFFFLFFMVLGIFIVK